MSSLGCTQRLGKTRDVVARDALAQLLASFRAGRAIRRATGRILRSLSLRGSRPAVANAADENSAGLRIRRPYEGHEPTPPASVRMESRRSAKRQSHHAASREGAREACEALRCRRSRSWAVGQRTPHRSSFTHGGRSWKRRGARDSRPARAAATNRLGRPGYADATAQTVLIGRRLHVDDAGVNEPVVRRDRQPSQLRRLNLSGIGRACGLARQPGRSRGSRSRRRSWPTVRFAVFGAADDPTALPPACRARARSRSRGGGGSASHVRPFRSIAIGQANAPS
jgi:hypothetical protein